MRFVLRARRISGNPAIAKAAQGPKVLSNPYSGGRGDSLERGAGLLILAVAALALFGGWAVREQVAVTRWQSSCLHIPETAWADAPMKDGEPDYSQVKLHGLKIDKGCGIIQVERTK